MQADVFHWVVYYQYGNNWNYQVLNRNDLSYGISQTIKLGNALLQLKKVAVSAVDRLGNESEKKMIEIVK